MKTIEQLQEEYPDPTQRKGAMTLALNRYGVNMNADIYQRAMFNWQIQLYEFIIRMFTPDDVEQAEALNIFRQFAQDSHLAATYNALVSSTEKKLVVAK